MYIWVSITDKSGINASCIDFSDIINGIVKTKDELYSWFNTNVKYYFLDTKDRTIEALSLSEINKLLKKHVKLYGFKPEYINPPEEDDLDSFGTCEYTYVYCWLLSELKLKDFIYTQRKLHNNYLSAITINCRLLDDYTELEEFSKKLKAPQLGFLFPFDDLCVYLQILDDYNARPFIITPTSNVDLAVEQPILMGSEIVSVDNTSPKGLGIVAESWSKFTLSGFYEYCQETWGNNIIYWATLYD